MSAAERDAQGSTEPTVAGSQVRGRLIAGGVWAVWLRTAHSNLPWLSLRTGRRARWSGLTDLEVLPPGEHLPLTESAIAWADVWVESHPDASAFELRVALEKNFGAPIADRVIATRKQA